MTATISNLLSRYEKGLLGRRELIAAIATVTATSTTMAAVPGVGRLDHISLQVSDLRRSRDFCVNTFGASVNTTPRPENEIRVDFGQSGSIVLRRASTLGQVDHLGLKVEGFDRPSVARQLRAAGVSLVDAPNVPGTPGFHVIDPDGFKVQLL